MNRPRRDEFHPEPGPHLRRLQAPVLAIHNENLKALQRGRQKAQARRDLVEQNRRERSANLTPVRKGKR